MQHLRTLLRAIASPLLEQSPEGAPLKEHYEPADNEPACHRRLSFAVAGSCLAALLTIALLNYVVNPHGKFATNFFKPYIFTSRLAKLEAIADLDEPPEAIILGSSRVMTMEPAQVRRRTGLRTYNAGVYSARTEDYLAILRYLKSVHPQPPKLIILGVDVQAFHNTAPVDDRLVATSRLAEQIPESITWWSQVKLLDGIISLQQTRDSLSSLHRSYFEPTSRSAVFGPDGHFRQVRVERAIEQGTFDLAQSIAGSKDKYLQRYQGYDRLGQRRCHFFETFLDMCEREGTHVAAFLTPMHPTLRAYLEEHTTYPARYREVDDYLKSLADRYKLTYLDFTHLSAFGGLQDEFADGVHPRPENTRRMTDVILRRLQADHCEAVLSKDTVAPSSENIGASKPDMPAEQVHRGA